jgi:hypothetical protein
MSRQQRKKHSSSASRVQVDSLLTLCDRTDQDYCTGKHIGYKPVELMSGIDGTNFNTVGTHVADSLTNALVLHPVACGLAFIAALLALGGAIGSLVGTFVAIIAWIVALVVLVIDFVIFGVRLAASRDARIPC